MTDMTPEELKEALELAEHTLKDKDAEIERLDGMVFMYQRAVADLHRKVLLIGCDILRDAFRCYIKNLWEASNGFQTASEMKMKNGW